MKKRIAGPAAIMILMAAMLLCNVRQSLANDWASLFERISRDIQASIYAATKPYKPVYQCDFVYTWEEALHRHSREGADDDGKPAQDGDADIILDSVGNVVTSASGQEAKAVAAAQGQAKQEFKNEMQAARRLTGKAKRDAMVAAQLKYQRVMRALSGLQALIKERNAAGTAAHLTEKASSGSKMQCSWSSRTL